MVLAQTFKNIRICNIKFLIFATLRENLALDLRYPRAHNSFQPQQPSYLKFSEKPLGIGPVAAAMELLLICEKYM